MRCVKDRYKKAGRLLINKLPLNNPAIKALSYLYPEKRQHSNAISGLEKLFCFFGYMLTDSQKLCVADEIREFVTNK